MPLNTHELAFRGQAAMDRLRSKRLVVCGAGALGSHLVDTLVRQGCQTITVIDVDRVEAHNIGTQVYTLDDVGALKVQALQAHCFRVAGVEIGIVHKRLDDTNVARLLRQAELVIDCFDNSAARRLVTDYCLAQQIPAVHLGMNTDYSAVTWNVGYRVPADVPVPDVCAYPLARTLILLTVALGNESIIRWITEERQENLELTLRDFQVTRRILST